ncbi:NADPH-dependent F420 reductase [Actinoplanes auranticolor]|uniref:NADP oxidoreductase n=1 Tax=Actinoplanes auranticolor TaxID=47988 RepID=A0A919SHS5_9ACTN|nr:NADP oxidoreductase [Actinoplanes auranticolor]
MRIGIIGAGKAGATLARLFVDAGHDVAIAETPGTPGQRDPESPLDCPGRATGVDEAMRHGDIVVLAIPFGRYRDLPAEALSGKTVIDTTSYDRQRDGSVPELDDDRNATSSELVQHHLAGAHVVKAFTALPADHLREHRPSESSGERYGIAVSGDHTYAKRQVIDLAEQLGFEPVDAGDLAAGSRIGFPTDHGHHGSRTAPD